MKPNKEPIDRFRYKYFFLSNFNPVYFVFNGQVWRTAEHAYHAAKTDDEEEINSIVKCTLLSDVRKAGEKVTLRKDWEDVKDEIMFLIVACKFIQNNEHLYRLLKTRDRDIVEGNNWHDNEWGDCFCPKCKEIEGKNKLGKILMFIRNDIINNGKESSSWKIGSLQEDGVDYIKDMIKCSLLPDPDEDIFPSIKKVVSGGQTGSERGSLTAAMDAGVDVGGWCLKGRKSEDGKIPDRFPLKETDTTDYMELTKFNIDDTDLTIVFITRTGDPSDIVDYAEKQNKPILVVDLDKRTVKDTTDALKRAVRKFNSDVTVNVTGSSESESPGIEKRVLEVMHFLMG